MTRLSVCGLGVSCNEMNDTPMLLVVSLLSKYLKYLAIRLVKAVDYKFYSCIVTIVYILVTREQGFLTQNSFTVLFVSDCIATLGPVVKRV